MRTLLKQMKWDAILVAKVDVEHYALRDAPTTVAVVVKMGAKSTVRAPVKVLRLIITNDFDRDAILCF